MATSGISGLGSTNAAGAASGGAFGSLKSEDFIKVMIAELANQDPFKPQDSSALLEQFSNLRNVESQLALQDRLQQLVMQNQISAAGGMIGKMVAGLDASDQPITGLVTSVRVENEDVILELDSGKSLPVDRLMRMSGVAADQAAVA